MALPNTYEQKEIVEFIQAELIKLDSVIEESRLAIELLTERRSALISAAVTGKIDVRNWQPEADSSEVLPMAAEEPAAYETSEP